MDWQILQSINEELTDMRKNAGLQQQELAAMLRIAQSMLSRYENGVSKVPAHVARQWAQKCGYKMEFIKCDS